MQALILAGGLGTRLRLVVADRPKVLALIQDKPFLTYLLEYLGSQGFSRIVLALGYRCEQVMCLYKQHDFAFDLHFSIEEQPLGTGGAILHAMPHLLVDEPVCVINGDTFLAMDYAALYAFHRQQQVDFTMTLSYQMDTARYGCVTVKDLQVINFFPGQARQAGYINAGVYLLHPKIFDRFDLPTNFSFERDFLQCHVQGLKPAAFCTEVPFIDIGVPQDYERAQKFFVKESISQ
jgi:D-glycero-alpha-D-manno-heptose 1-phosphate guanylyltransferase